MRISEIPPNSILHQKRSYETWGGQDKERADDKHHNGFYVQLTIGDNAIVFDMKGREVAMLSQLG